ncbi:BC1872 family protein [Alicyclobacillus suci]|uniref:BC1872 family protein n=1 Tax=Alicyclobacillus suci TaxID=2816080 RepID=UPI001A8F6820|nr:hypothetical protein [Alicyclobacillus suci]
MAQYDWATMTQRQRDALVAEQVMGYQVVSYDGLLVSWDGGDDIWSGVNRGGVPSYTTDISAAWEVVEQLRTRFYVDIELSEPALGVTVGLSDADGQVECTTCASAPEAISLAALRAKGVDV